MLNEIKKPSETTTAVTLAWFVEVTEALSEAKEILAKDQSEKAKAWIKRHFDPAEKIKQPKSKEVTNGK